jgi:hypothetical protein
MKKILFFVVLILIFNLSGYAQTQPTTTAPAKDLNLGRTYFPRDFMHAGKNFNKGVYRVTLTEKDGFPWFKIMNNKKELLFEEMAVVLPNEGKSKNFRYRVKREMLRGYEYFRIKVTKPDQLIMAYFLVEREQEKPEAPKAN